MGTVLLRGSTTSYDIRAQLNGKKGVNVIGEGCEGAFPEIVNRPITKLVWNGASGGTMFSTLDTEQYVGEISNMTLDGNNLANIGLQLIQPQGSLFRNLTVKNTKAGGQGVLLTAVSAINGNAVLNTFLNVRSHDHANVGFELFGANDTHVVTLNDFINCRFSANAISLRINQYADTNQWFGGRIEAMDSAIGLVLGEGNMVGVYQNNFHSTTFDGFGSGAIGIQCKQTETGQPHVFHACPFGGTWGTKVNPLSGSLMKFRECPNFVTRNSGVSTGTGAQQSIAHGLNVTPSRVVLSDWSTGSANARQSAGADSTYIYVTATLDKDYLWEAWLDYTNQV